MINESEIVKKLQQDKNIRYFKLPEDNGWNSGRAVLISQVQTEYFVTCDGDFIFNGATRKDLQHIICCIPYTLNVQLSCALIFENSAT